MTDCCGSIMREHGCRGTDRITSMAANGCTAEAARLHCRAVAEAITGMRGAAVARVIGSEHIAAHPFYYLPALYARMIFV